MTLTHDSVEMQVREADRASTPRTFNVTIRILIFFFLKAMENLLRNLSNKTTSLDFSFER